MCVLELRRSFCRFKSCINSNKYWISLQHSSVAYISDLAEYHAVMFWHLEVQGTGPCSVRKWPKKDLDLCNSSVRLGWKVVNWSCPPQFASEIPVRWCVDLLGNWRKLCRMEPWELFNWMQWEEVPLRYFIMDFTALRWPGDEQCWYWERRAVAVEISGLVQWNSHWRSLVASTF